MSDDNASAGDDSSESIEQGVSSATYEPVVVLSNTELESGEADEDVVYKQRVALHRFVQVGDNPSEWKERGKGDIRFLKHKVTGSVRVVMRQEKTGKLICNHSIHASYDLRPNPGSDKFWMWRALDCSDETPQMDTLGVRFKTPEIANEYKQKWDDYRSNNEKLAKSSPQKSSTAAASSAATAAAPAPSTPAKGGDSKSTATPAAGNGKSAVSGTPAKGNSQPAVAPASVTPASAPAASPSPATAPVTAAASPAPKSPNANAGSGSGSGKKKKKKNVKK